MTRFRDNKDGTVTDTKTGLIWLKKVPQVTTMHTNFSGSEMRVIRAIMKMKNKPKKSAEEKRRIYSKDYTITPKGLNNINKRMFRRKV